MADWLVEEGIGEDRAIRLEGASIVEARIDWPGKLAAGQVEDAVLVARSKGSARGTARFASGEEALIDRLPRDAAEGARIRLAITRSAIAERGRFKLAQARPSDLPPRPASSLGETLREEGHTARIVHRFPREADWAGLFAEVWSGSVAFDGGSLILADTPAMTLIDIDAPASAEVLAKKAVPAIAGALRRFDIGGSIGVDFPTLAGKADRRRVDEALAEALNGWPHERTAMNGFGFVQIVTRLTRPSMFQRIRHSRLGAATRILLRRAEMLDGAGALLLTCHPAVKPRMQREWLEELARRTGRNIRIETDPALAIETSQAQLVAP